MISKYIKLLEETTQEESRIYNYHTTFKNHLKRLKEPGHEEFLQFLWNQRTRGLTIARSNKYCSTYFKILKDFDLTNITQDEMDFIFLKIKNLEISNNSKRSHLTIVKQIFKYLDLNTRPLQIQKRAKTNLK